MNKQELIEYTQEERRTHQKKSEFQCGYRTAMKHMYDRLVLLDEPEKPVVPQFVADWYEDNKDDLEYNIYRLSVAYNHQELTSRALSDWFGNDLKTKPIETLVKMKLYNYKVEKEKRYTVEIPNPNASERGVTFLARNADGKVELYTWTCYTSIEFENNWKQEEYAQLTEDEIKEDYAWAWEANLAKEVKE